MRLLFIFILGVGILAGALMLNLISSRFGLTNWYEFLKDPGRTSSISYVWLFVLYPFGLGLFAYTLSRYLY